METQYILISTDLWKERQGDGELNDSLVSPIWMSSRTFKRIKLLYKIKIVPESLTVQDLCYRAAAGILTSQWVIQIPGSEGRSSLLSSRKWLFFFILRGAGRTDRSWHGAIHSTFSPRHINTAQRLSASANWNMPPCCWGVQVCVYVWARGYT